MKQISLIALSIISLALAGCGGASIAKPTPLKAGDTALITYTIRDMKGAVLETNVGSSPRSIVIGSSNDFVKPVQDMLIGKQVGYSDTVTIKPEQGFGYLYDPRNVQQLPLKMFTIAGQNPEIGGIQDLGGVKGIVKSIDGTGDAAIVVVDLNPYQSRNDVSIEFAVVAPDASSNTSAGNAPAGNGSTGDIPLTGSK